MTRDFLFLSIFLLCAFPPGSPAGETRPNGNAPEPGAAAPVGTSRAPSEAFMPESDLVVVQDPSEDEKDPFAYRLPTSEEGEFIPTSRARVPRGVRILSIIHIRGAGPIAAIHVPHSTGGELHYVRAGDVIQIDSLPYQQVTQRTQTQTARGRRGRVTETETRESTTTNVSPADYFYLLVKNIAKDFVEIAPRARPQDAVILR
ncbi:MAG: hypothetical protein LBE84_11295 [Planctomycetota bacterium]|jgi:hypothetical protein|nr:hypothetical protein [Planctomycetota bacterium]